MTRQKEREEYRKSLGRKIDRKMTYSNSDGTFITNELVEQIRTEAISQFVEKADSAILQDYYNSDLGEYRLSDVSKTLRKVAQELGVVEI